MKKTKPGEKQEASLHKTREAIAAYKNLKLGRRK